MADGDKAADEVKDEKKAPTRRAPAKAETKPERDSVVNEKVNMVDGKPEKIADPRTTTEAFDAKKAGEETKVAAPEESEYAPTPWTETSDRLDNRKGDQQVTPGSWDPVPQHVDGGEVQDKRKLDNRG